MRRIGTTLSKGTCFGLIAAFMLLGAVSQAQDRFWTEISQSPIGSGDPEINAIHYKSLRLDTDAIRTVLAQAPIRGTSGVSEVILSLPMPDGSFEDFMIFDSPIMQPGLAAKFPDIGTYTAQGVTNRGSVAKLDWTRSGFHAMVLTPGGRVFIDPYDRSSTDFYISYYARDLFRTEEQTFEEYGPLGAESEAAREVRRIVERGLPQTVSTGEELRTYRLAVAATGEYTQFHGGSVNAGMAAIVTAMNRVNGIYENEISVTMVLVDNNDLVVFTDGATDPYDNLNGGAMLGQNQTTLDNIIGDANYDIGHVFSTGGGGVAFLAVPCRSGWKAQGVTGLPAPIGDPFYIDYVCHEMGHQYGATHTFNGNAGACSGNRTSTTAYEPGSGSTIMAYSGICGGQNLQDQAGEYFHGASLDQMITYTQLGSGSTCPVVTNTGNTPPTADAGTTIYTIPIETPFFLVGDGSDVDGDTLTFCWEQFDLGPAGDPNAPSGNAPIFRSFTPTTNSTRIFPQISDILGGTQTLGEILPTYARTLNFRLTVRDNRAAGGGIGDDATQVVVSDEAGPFVITHPQTETIWALGSTDSITWDVANTDIAPVNVTNVNILLSTDGGLTFDDTIAANTPNDGHQVIDVPDFYVDDARVKIESVGNIFFDISRAPILITDLTIPVHAYPEDGSEDQPTELNIGWNGVSAATSYHAQVSLHVGFAFGFVLDDSSVTDTTVLVTGMELDRTYYWRVRSRNDSSDSYWSDGWSLTTTAVTSVGGGEESSVPQEFALGQNYPNPFNPSTTIRYAVPGQAHVRIEVVNLLGETVALLVDEPQVAGYHTVTMENRNLSSGVYLYRLVSGDFIQTKKLVLLK